MRLDSASSPGTAGWGLGLAISRELAIGLHGSLSVRSEVGQGSSFTLRLPREAHGVSNGTSAGVSNGATNGVSKPGTNGGSLGRGQSAFA